MTDTTALPDEPMSNGDAQIVVAVAADKLSARMTVVPSPGDSAVTREQVLGALESAGVVHGIKLDAIEGMATTGLADAVLVAEGTAPVDGEDASFQGLIPEIKDRGPKVDEHGTVDFRNLGIFFSVKAGTALMRRTPATAGVAGNNVLGEAIPAKPGKDIPFAPQIGGAAVDPNDPNLLVASITGQPVMVTHGVAVEPTLTLPNVDLATGHVEFEGSVTVVGDVKVGMKIQAAGDVTVGGVVEAAEITALGDVTIKGGVIGHSEWIASAEAPGDAARIVCDGSVHTLFAENAWIEAGSCIFIHDAARQSHLSAINKVVVGKEDASTGQIIGGRTQATVLVQAAVVGSTAGVRTCVEVGVNPRLSHKLEVLNARLQQLAKEQADIARLLTYARAHPQKMGADVLHRAERTAAILERDIATCVDEKAVFQSQMSLADDASCVIGQKIYGGGQVKIGDQAFEVQDERGRGVIRLADGVLCFTGH